MLTLGLILILCVGVVIGAAGTMLAIESRGDVRTRERAKRQRIREQAATERTRRVLRWRTIERAYRSFK